MANKVLFISSLIFGFIHFLLADNIYIAGIITSILNHLLTNKKIKILDRMFMILYFAYDLLYKNTELIVIAALFYLLAKYYNNDTLHIIAHFTITLAHIFL